MDTILQCDHVNVMVDCFYPQDEINSLQKTRDSLTEELTSVSSKLENVEQDSWRLADLRTRYNVSH